jgi:hypothetical protein
MIQGKALLTKRIFLWTADPNLDWTDRALHDAALACKIQPNLRVGCEVCTHVGKGFLTQLLPVHEVPEPFDRVILDTKEARFKINSLTGLTR